MNIIDKYSDEIDAYVQGRMSDEDKVRFEKLLETEEVLKNEVNKLLWFKESYHRKDILEFKKKLDAIESSESVSTDSSVIDIRPRKNYAMWAAAATVIIIIGTYFVLNRGAKKEPQLQTTETEKQEVIEDSLEYKTPNEQQEPQLVEGEISTPKHIEEEVEVLTPEKTNKYLALAESIYTPFDFNVINENVRGDGNTIDKAINDFANNNFQKGENDLNELLKSDPEFLDAHYYLGLAAYNQRKFDQVIAHYELILEDDEYYLYVENVQWYLAISHLHVDQKEKSKVLLQEIIQDVDHKYYQNAKSVFSSMENL